MYHIITVSRPATKLIFMFIFLSNCSMLLINTFLRRSSRVWEWAWLRCTVVSGTETTLHAKIQDCFQTGVWNSMYKRYPNSSSHCYWGVGSELESSRINTAEIKTLKLFPCVVWKLQSFEFRFIVHTCQALYPYYLIFPQMSVILYPGFWAWLLNSTVIAASTFIQHLVFFKAVSIRYTIQWARRV